MPQQALFMSFMLLGMITTMTSSSWLTAWFGLEMNTLAFIPILTNQKNKMTNEAMLKYFLTQALASALMMIPILMFAPTLHPWSNTQSMIILLALTMKMGAAPFHFWMPQVMEGLTWSVNMVLTTIQKIAPMVLILATKSTLMTTISALSLLTGALGGYNQTSLRKLMAYSSISHMGGMILAATISNSLTMMYLMIYILLSLTIMMMFLKMNSDTTTQTHQLPTATYTLMMINLLSLAGLPPFLGFYPKWMIISQTIETNKILLAILITTSMITLFFYLRVTYSAFLLTTTPQSTKKMSTTMLVLSSLSLWSIPIMLPLL